MQIPTDLKELIPRDKHDHKRAEAAINAGYPAVDPILWELLEWIQDMNWPVAQTLAPFLSSIGLPLVPYIERIFETDDEVWKYWIMGAIMRYSREVAEAFREVVTRIAYAPTENELNEELPGQALYILELYGWQKQQSDL